MSSSGKMLQGAYRNEILLDLIHTCSNALLALGIISCQLNCSPTPGEYVIFL